MKFKRNILLKNYTTFKIGGPAEFFFEAKTRESLIKAVGLAKERKLPFFILGGGSNLLVSDKGYKGLVIIFQFASFNLQKNKIIVGAGARLANLVNYGLEWAAGIPGTVGGAIYGNAGAFGESMGDEVKSVEVFDANNGKIKVFKNKDCHFAYRRSVFKKKKNLIILSAEIEAGRSNLEKVKEYLDYRIQRHPQLPSAGSIFKNPGKTPAAILIHQAGLTGKKIGQAQISDKHSNFIVNLGNAKAEDVKELINLAKKTLKNKFKIILEEETQYLP